MATSTMDRGPREHDLTVAITDAIADATGRDPIELDPLYETIDPEALNALFAGREATDVRLSFRYEGYTVVVDEQANVRVEATPSN